MAGTYQEKAINLLHGSDYDVCVAKLSWQNYNISKYVI